MAGRSPAGSRGYPRPGPGAAGTGDRRRRRSSPVVDRPSRRGQEHAGRPPARHPAAADAGAKAGGRPHLQRGRRERTPAHVPDAAVPDAAPYGLRCGHHRRRQRAAAGRDLQGHIRGAVPRRVGELPILPVFRGGNCVRRRNMLLLRQIIRLSKVLLMHRCCIKCNMPVNIGNPGTFRKSLYHQILAFDAMFTLRLDATMQQSCIKRLYIALDATMLRHMQGDYLKIPPLVFWSGAAGDVS